MYVFCQAGRYQQLFLLDEKGDVSSRDIPKVLGTIKCEADVQGQPLPNGYNSAVMRVKRIFDETAPVGEATVIITDPRPTLRNRELSVLFRASEDEDKRAIFHFCRRRAAIR
jgi:hypothetical protein